MYSAVLLYVDLSFSLCVYTVEIYISLYGQIDFYVTESNTFLFPYNPTRILGPTDWMCVHGTAKAAKD